MYNIENDLIEFGYHIPVNCITSFSMLYILGPTDV